ncbi:ABC transporter permease [Jatrophihabitans lederbergiae]|uniref:ABC transporter permease n=1 Tax=Jatrophihabitans lederbergiae TaxID=3075547 RepID=A0ABU2JGV7_9ACTN|nr:ABC transporter permease [Jatrophihabitans sp. DSM 44399]MDT0263468.1 ABC transporter permease [Jatrophihabitans sp. DSM 44399]
MAGLHLLGRRLLQMVPIIIGITVVSFVLIRLVPGDPATLILGNHYTPAGAAQIRHSLGLDQGIAVQYWRFVRGALTGSFGHSYSLDASVGHLIVSSLGSTLFLIVMAGIFTAALSIPLGLYAGLHRGGVVDQGTRIFLLIGFALPGFLLGVLLILVFGVKIPILPINGYGSGFLSHVRHLILPSITLAVPFSTVLVRSLRASVIETINADFVTTALLKGIPWRRVVLRHILRNAGMSVVVVFGVNLAFLVGGTVVIENVFSVPGLGSLLVNAVSTRDYPVVQGLTLVFALFVLLVNLLTDAVHIAIDPRLAAG